MPKVSEEYKQEKRKQIIDATERVWKRKTLLAINMQDIIDESGLSQGNIYRYYSDLDAILARLLVKYRTQANFIPSLDRIFSEYSAFDDVMEQILILLGSFMEEGMETYCKLDYEFNVMSMTYPKRAEKILSLVNQDSVSNLGYLSEQTLKKFAKEGVQLKISPGELMAFLGAAYSGIQMNALQSYSGNPMLPWKDYRPSAQMHLLGLALRNFVEL